MNNEQQRITVTPDADAILDRLPYHTRLCQDVLVSHIRRRQFPMTVSSTGRVFNAVTGIKRELRTAIRLAGDAMGSVDIRCAQPGLLAMMLSTKNPTNGPKPRETYKHACCPAPSLPSPFPCSGSDVSSFTSLASTGCLYEHLMAATGLDRDVLKHSFLRDVLAKRGRYPSVVEDAFRDAFPSVHRIIREINRHDHGDLIRLLQRAESWLVVETVSPRLLGRWPFISLHDAIFSRHHDVGEVEGQFREVFEELGIELALKVET